MKQIALALAAVIGALVAVVGGVSLILLGGCDSFPKEEMRTPVSVRIDALQLDHRNTILFVHDASGTAYRVECGQSAPNLGRIDVSREITLTKIWRRYKDSEQTIMGCG
jgi:hypothetical protein